MSLNDVLQVAKTYPYVDIENNGRVVRKQFPTADLTEGLLRSYLSIYSSLSVIPKKMIGSSPSKITEETLQINKADLGEGGGLGGFDSTPVMHSGSAESQLYKIMYENARAEASDYKRKYEDAINDKHKAEIELASKGGGFGEVVQGLAGFAPMLFANSQAPALGEAQASVQQAQAQVVRKADVRLQGITKHFSTLNDDEKNKVYNLLVKVFSDMSKIDEILPLLD